jgi:hypothetical protein
MTYTNQFPPSVHVYPDPNVANGLQAYDQVLWNLQVLQPILPASLQNHIWLTETGAPAGSTTACPNGWWAGTVNDYMNRLIESSAVRGMTDGILFWRLMDLPAGTTNSCEYQMGMVNSGNWLNWQGSNLQAEVQKVASWGW